MPEEVLPGIPTVDEFLPGYEASGWYGIGVPKATPVKIVDELNRAINTGLADSELKARIATMGATVFSSSSADYGKLLAEETKKWAKVIKFAGMKPD
jgi:tripartite-type tricarboxylate transporter receptor subunit TctC